MTMPVGDGVPPVADAHDDPIEGGRRRFAAPARLARLRPTVRRASSDEAPEVDDELDGDDGTPGMAAAPEPPMAVPEGRPLELSGRGTTWVYDLAGPQATPERRSRPDAEAPALVLLHGWTANAALNWFSSFEPLNERWRVVALDHRGHGRGIRSRRRFRLEDCADDVVAVADELGIDRFVPVGYSMGGPIAQLTWQRHRDRVAGLVLCATAGSFRGRPGERVLFSMMTAMSLMARVTPGNVRHQLNQRLVSERGDDSPLSVWARSELRRNDPRMVVEAGQAIGQFSSAEWLGGVDVPSAVVLTEYDAVVPPHRQERLAATIPGATLHRVRGNHTVCAGRPQNFVPALVEACESVTTRAARRQRSAG
jgi:3-oxoadipate enol-lactonase